MTDITKKEGDTVATTTTTFPTTPPTASDLTTSSNDGGATEKPQNGAKGEDELPVKAEVLPAILKDE